MIDWHLNIGESIMHKIPKENFKTETWYKNLHEEAQYIFDLIHKYHQYFSRQDRRYRNITRVVRILILSLSMINTVVLGIKTAETMDNQVIAGLVISALITFVTAISSYFNFEEYWMRNITVHIELNILRDNFIYDAKSGALKDKEKLESYKKALEALQKKNEEYWMRSIKNIG